eukprot:gene9162-11228_t
MNQVFEKITLELDKEFQLRQDIKLITTQIDNVERRLNMIVQNVHSTTTSTTSTTTTPSIYKSLLPELEPLKKHFNDLKQLIQPLSYYKYRDHWKSHLSQIVFCLTFTYWLENESLLKLDDIQLVLGFDNNIAGSIVVELEDYLIGLCNLSNEMSRYCVNCVIRQDYETPFKISNFISDIFSGFRLLNLKNDIIRKRYDSMKYDVKKIEEVVYDISLRGLNKKSSTTTTTTTTSSTNTPMDTK